MAMQDSEKTKEQLLVALDLARRRISAFETDAAERKRTEKTLFKEGALQRAIFNSVNFSSIATDAKGVIQIFNVGAERMLGYAADEVINKLTPADISDPQELISRAEALTAEFGAPISPGFEALVFKASRGIEDIYELTKIRKDGSRFPAVVSVTALRDDQNAIIGYLLIGTDNTAHKRAEELRDQIEQVIRHDLRTPAGNAIQVARMLCKNTNLTGQQRYLIGLLEQAGKDMIETLDSSLDLYRIEVGRYRKAFQAFDCLAVAGKTIATLTEQAGIAGVRMEILVNGQPQRPGSHCPCHGEPKLLRTALQNLLVNALEASPPGGKVVVDLSPDQGCRIEIRNQGVVPKDIRGRFFEKYVTQGKKSGTGLGTYSAKMMIEAQDGGIEMRTSEADNETVVTLRMPC
jgi:signal transduction histidine kinase